MLRWWTGKPVDVGPPGESKAFHSKWSREWEKRLRFIYDHRNIYFPPHNTVLQSATEKVASALAGTYRDDSSSVCLSIPRGLSFIYLFIFKSFIFTRAGSRDKRRRARVVQTLQKKLRRVRKCLFDSFSFFLFCIKRVASGLFIGAEWRHCGLWSDQDWISQQERIFSSAETWHEAAVWCGEELETGNKKGGGAWRSALVCITAAPRLIYFL